MTQDEEPLVKVSIAQLRTAPYCRWMDGTRCPLCRAIMRPYNIRMIDLGTGGDYALHCENPTCVNSNKIAVITDMFVGFGENGSEDGDEYAWFDVCA